MLFGIYGKKSKQTLWHPTPFIQKEYLFFDQKKKGNRQLNGLAYNSMV